MKMSKETYNALKASVEKITKDKILAYIESVRQSKRYKVLQTRIVWDVYNACRLDADLPKTAKEEMFELNDKHIETAMKRIFKELQINLT